MRVGYYIAGIFVDDKLLEEYEVTLKPIAAQANAGWLLKPVRYMLPYLHQRAPNVDFFQEIHCGMEMSLPNAFRGKLWCGHP